MTTSSGTSLAAIEGSLIAAGLPPQIVQELLQAYAEAKRSFFLGGHRLNAVEGGRFCEASFRILEDVTSGSYTALGKQIDTDGLIRSLSQLPSRDFPESIRLHIPRTLRVIYDIRNKRDTAHLGKNIDPSLQDATLVMSCLNWVLAELVRLYHGVSADEAQQIIDGLVAREVPTIQSFDGVPRILRTDLAAGDYCLVLLYFVGSDGVEFNRLAEWVRPSMKTNLRRTLQRLDDRALIYKSGTHYTITWEGEGEVLRRELIYT